MTHDHGSQEKRCYERVLFIRRRGYNWSMKVLFVCTGNTCRSPMAEGIAKLIFPGEYSFSSAGIKAFPGDNVSPKALSVLSQKGIDISKHQTVRITREEIDLADLVITMTEAQKQQLRSSYPQDLDKIKKLGDWTGSGREVLDPWGGSLEIYRCCAEEIEQMLKQIVK